MFTCVGWQVTLRNLLIPYGRRRSVALRWVLIHTVYAQLVDVLSAAIPGPPASVRLIGITDDSVTVEWTAPTTDGGRPVTRYVVERRDAHQPTWTHVASLPARTTVCQVSPARRVPVQTEFSHRLIFKDNRS